MRFILFSKFTPAFDANTISPEIQERIDDVKEISRGIAEKKTSGLPIFVQVIKGDYRGSIARLNITFQRPFSLENRPHWHCNTPNLSNARVVEISYSIAGRLNWDGRKNEIQFSMSDCVYLPDYTGPTVFKMVDKKAQKAKIIAATAFKDRYGKVLAVGDKVTYVDIRYGSGSSIERGTVHEIIVRAKKPAMVILNEDGTSKSTIESVSNLVMKND